MLSLPLNHRFPMSKYEVLPAQLLHEGTLNQDNFFKPETIDEKWILRTHEEAYWLKLKTLSLTPKEVRRTGFPLTHELIQREITIMNGTLQAVDFAVQYGVAMNIAGGTHHAFTNKGEGFCLLNDIAIAANYALDQKLANKVLIIDLDVHQGNGTAQIFRHDDRVFTFSMHGANNYPMVKEHSDLDIGLPDFTDDKFYLKTLATNLDNIMEKFYPDLIFFQSGVDVLATDKLGKLSLTQEGCKTRDRIVLELAHKNKIPLVASMGGGYSTDFKDIINAHANTYRLAQQIFF
ncbi:MAG: histone deacetylase [Cyclobacteriaceae bacterium]|nr:histone deacetylase [Cyclobacteriaceae bacterium]